MSLTRLRHSKPFSAPLLGALSVCGGRERVVLACPIIFPAHASRTFHLRELPPARQLTVKTPSSKKRKLVRPNSPIDHRHSDTPPSSAPLVKLGHRSLLAAERPIGRYHLPAIRSQSYSPALRLMPSHLQSDGAGADVLRRSSSATPECLLPTGASSPSNAYAGLTLNSDRGDHEMTNGDAVNDGGSESNGSTQVVANGLLQEVKMSMSNEESYRPVRSASPAVKRPASELDHSDDPQDVPALEDGTPRENVEVSDQTANEKYNGTSTLAMMGPKQDETIVLEEPVRGSNGGGDEMSEAKLPIMVDHGSIPISITKGKSTTVKNIAKKGSAAGSRTASPAPSVTGVMTRGRARKNGKTLGTCGLSNLGNTCYMNSALQCVRSVEELTQYFRLDKYKADLNPTNRLAYNGEVARAYAHLLGQIYAASCPASISPRSFKGVIGRHRPSFSGFGQQDSQEFLGFLLDGLQEDLYRIPEKPSFEIPDSTDEMVKDPAALQAFADKCWELYKARNDSVIVDLFAGTYKSTLVCPTCHKVSITFDPFNNLTLQLPIESIWTKDVVFVPLEGRPIRVTVDMDKNGSIRMLKEFVGARVHVEPERLFAAEVYKNKFYKAYEDFVCPSENIQPDDWVYLFELDSVPTNWPPSKQERSTRSASGLFATSLSDEEDESARPPDPLTEKMLVPVLHRLPAATNNRFSAPSVQDLPFYMIVTREEANDYDALLKKVLARVATLTTRDIFAEVSNEGPNTPDEDVVVVMGSTEDTDSSDARTKTHSVEGEEDLVAVDMKVSRQPSQMDSSAEQSVPPQAQPQPDPQPDPPHPQPRRRPRVLEPGSFIPGELQRMFQMRVFKEGTELVPTGWGVNFEGNRDYPLIQTRIPIVSTQSSPEQGPNGSPPSSQTSSSDSDPLLHSGGLSNRSFAVSGDFSDSDSNPASDRLPPMGKILANHRKGGKSRVMGRKKGWRNGGRGAKYTYSRKQQRIESEAESVDVVTPGPLIRLGEGLILEWDPAVYSSLFNGQDDSGLRGRSTWEPREHLIDEELLRKRAVRATRRKQGVSLEDCLDEFDKEEILSENNAWYCPKCKAFRRASKKLELWKAPDILIIHLKRFSASRTLRDKLEVFVDFPTEGLDLTKRVAMKEEGKETVYDLIAVDNHYGGLGGGHYTAIARNFVDGEWYDYNDTMTAKRTPQHAVTNAAYLLFYRRRSTRPLGGPYFESMMEEAQEQQQSPATSSRSSSSPAGDEARFGDSSRAGSSNESPEAGVGANRHGKTSMTSMAMVPYQRPEEERVMTTTELEQDELPGYESLYPTAGPSALNLGPSASNVNDRMDLDEGIDTSYNVEEAGPSSSSASLLPARRHLLAGAPSWGFDHLRNATGVISLQQHQHQTTGGGQGPQNSSDEEEDLMAASDKAADGGSSVDANLSDDENRMGQFADDDDDDDDNVDDINISLDLNSKGQLIAHTSIAGYGGHSGGGELDEEEDQDDEIHDLPPPSSAGRNSPVVPVTNIALNPETQKLYSMRSMTNERGGVHGGVVGGSRLFGGGGAFIINEDDEIEDVVQGQEVRIIASVERDDGEDDDEEEKVAEVHVGIDDQEGQEEWNGIEE
ncbi:MAG: CSN-associated deubiquitinating enzyme Ubp12 [Watsoniomyces obsoletus]|nr:MAG: CSN-associated deubiquitinating enzyme Ubp12 [Watsoniomyces obsoletus]